MTKTDLLAAFDKPAPAPATIDDLATLGAAIIRALTSATDQPNDYISRAELRKHFHVGEERLATALRRAKLQPLQIGRAQKYPRSIAIAAIAPHLS